MDKKGNRTENLRENSSMKNTDNSRTVNTRELITDTLLEIDKGKQHCHILIRNVLDKYQYLDENDRAFIKTVIQGTLEQRIRMDYCLDQISNTPVHKMKPWIRALMRMSAYQIMCMDKIPDRAVCNEAVKLAQKRKFQNLKGWVNAVLRNLARQKEEIAYPSRQKEPIQFLSIQYSMPEFLTKQLVEEYGMETAEGILQGMLKKRELYVRIQRNYLEEKSFADICMEWKQQGIEYKQSSLLKDAYSLKNTKNLGQLADFINGKYTVQNISSMLVCTVADIKKDMLVLDVCAAPGGKAIHAADLMSGTGHVLARDLTQYKVELIRENIERLKTDNITAEVFDATTKDLEMLEKADVVLADVPCSGIGVIGRKPDIKYNLSEDSLRSLEILQKQIIDSIWQYVKPEGVLIYSTCTIRREENEDMVSYIKNHYPFETESVETYLPIQLSPACGEDGNLKILPDGKMDGFFIARLRRKEAI